MFVSKSMTRKVITIDKNSVLLEAQKKMTRHRIRHLPVVDSDGHLVGMVTDRDIRSATPPVFLKDMQSPAYQEALEALKVETVMSTDLVTVSPMYTLQDALLLIQQKRVGAFPVVDENRILKGIISVRDLVRAFINVLGIGEAGNTSLYSRGRKNRPDEKNSRCHHRREYFLRQHSGGQILG